MSLDKVAQICVLHSWFTSFYAVSVSASLYWATELLAKGPTFRALAQRVPSTNHSMTYTQVTVVWAMMLVQGSRRLYECLLIARPSQSKMWFGHWLLGIAFYLATSIAIWIEGTASIQKQITSVKDVMITGPSIKSFVGIMLFMLASGFQHDCHAYLASLKDIKKAEGNDSKSDYRLPDHPAFNISVTPHYFAECLIYLSLAIAAAPWGQWINWTMFCALTFVAVNLGVTAHGTKLWYEKRFGAAAVQGKARMIPLLY
ncbi:related to 3-oxo-5-alpha-steroid 4-dehydrogenase [Lecanosticta acicola]|uniref:Polyprenal reductase n=1 Tax=Lecanosticta acicola TaxID=111012 RepID=A0AAI8YUF8_9PEZI|nr:related to 3-oxo-5-alpha-steroid 4-dehydrogenase [Lecanosticta acicola]